MTGPRPLRVCIDATVRDVSVGGIRQAILGLATGLSGLDGDDEYVFLVHADRADWLTPALSGPCRAELLAPPARPPLADALKRFRPALSAYQWLAERRARRPWTPPSSTGTVERLGADVVHFARQDAFLTDLPSLYQPYDLQHLHLPELFSPEVRARREAIYRTFAERATLVVMMSSWAARDITAQYGLAPEKVAVVPGAPAPLHVQRFDVSGAGVTVPDRPFLLVPAQTWPHKNHLGLLAALALARDRDRALIDVVLTGGRNRYATTVQREVRRLGLADQVTDLGYVDGRDLARLYEAALGVVVPTLFEGWGLPVVEAMAAGAPLACSNVTCLPDIVDGAALLFDPRDPTAMADQLVRLWSDPVERARLAKAGRRRAAEFSWDRSARMFRAHYRRLAGSPLTSDDEALLAAPALA